MYVLICRTKALLNLGIVDSNVVNVITLSKRSTYIISTRVNDVIQYN